jgi:putative membrane protein
MTAARRGLAGALTAAWLAGACGGDRRDAAAAAESAEVAASVPVAPAMPRLDDADIMHVVITANDISVRLARHAAGRARTADLVTFSEVVLADHGAANARVTELARALSVEPTDNGVSRRLAEDAAAALAEVENLSGSEYEAAYIALEAKQHDAVLNALDNALIPAAQNERLRQLLVNLRPAFAAHLQRALQIRGLLEGAAAGDTVGGQD